MPDMRRRQYICGCQDEVIDALHYLRGYNFEKRIQITFEIFKPQRSLKQNNRFHAWCDIIADELGNEAYDKAQMKRELKIICECPETEYVGIDGETRTERSTKRLNTTQMMKFEDRVWRFAATELGIQLPMTRAEAA